MTIDEFLKDIIASQDVKKDDEEIKNLQEERKEIQKIIKDNYEDAKKTIRYGGSYAKDTMIRDNFDLDILCYFHEDETSAGESLKDIYENLKNILEEKYYVESKKSALRLKDKENENDFHIDFVPGRFVDGSDGDAYLYQSGAEKNRLKTNPDKHIDHIKNSKLTDVIKLIKIWNFSNEINIKTFILELLVIKILNESKEKTLSEKLKLFFTKIKESIENMAIEDPANPNNDLSELFDTVTKNILKNGAESAIKNIENNDWVAVFNNRFEIEEDKTEEYEESKALILMDTSHCQLPMWPINTSVCNVKIRCFAKDNKNNNKGELKSDEGTIPDYWKLEYKAEPSNCPHNYEIYWQVVNTGYEAEKEDGLRGEFFRGKDLAGIITADQNTNHEMSLYRGKHWIECFVVSNNILIARSGRFYVNIVPKIKKPLVRKKQSVPYYRRNYR